VYVITFDTNKMPDYTFRYNVRHPKGIIFIDLHQIAFIDMEHSATQALHIADNIHYCTTDPSLWATRADIPQDNLCIIVGLCSSDMKCVSPFAQLRVSSTKYYYGDDNIPNGTMEVKV
jgi:hypothetical protein